MEECHHLVTLDTPPCATVLAGGGWWHAWHAVFGQVVRLLNVAAPVSLAAPL